jgi:hypothetical protein
MDRELNVTPTTTTRNNNKGHQSQRCGAILCTELKIRDARVECPITTNLSYSQYAQWMKMESNIFPT